MLSLKERVEATKAAKEAAKARITEEIQAEIDMREQIAKDEAEIREIERVERELSIQRKMDAAREKFGPSAKLSPVTIDGYNDIFIVTHARKAHEKWEHDIGNVVANPKLNRAEIARAYAVEAVVVWNDITEFGKDSTNGFDLEQYLKAHPGMVTPLVNEAARLAGFFKEERKS